MNRPHDSFPNGPRLSRIARYCISRGIQHTVFSPRSDESVHWGRKEVVQCREVSFDIRVKLQVIAVIKNVTYRCEPIAKSIGEEELIQVTSKVLFNRKSSVKQLGHWDQNN
jgi:hypothetical protein